MTEEIQGNYKCARKGMGVMVTQPRPGQTQKALITEAHIEAEKTQYDCNQGTFRSCPPNCQIATLIEKTKKLATPHHPYIED
ncbi:MAG: hypothetical protein AAB622_00980 [Patescibacteria group bacterium]